MKAIPQLHDGALYRSRTEARWAEFFTLAKLPFEYEPEGYDLAGEWYVPDFRVGHVWFEVKGAPPNEREHRVARSLANATGQPVFIASGNPGASATWAHFPGGEALRPCFIVEEFKSDDGAWIAEFLDGGGWAVPLRPGLANCAATGNEHPLLAVAGRLQFRVPAPVPEPDGFRSVGDLVAGILTRLSKGAT